METGKVITSLFHKPEQDVGQSVALGPTLYRQFATPATGKRSFTFSFLDKINDVKAYTFASAKDIPALFSGSVHKSLDQYNI